MTTFKNNSRYAEVLLTYLDVAWRDDTLIDVKSLLMKFEWKFKGGSLLEVAQRTKFKPRTSMSYYPNAESKQIGREWPEGRDSVALMRILTQRRMDRPMRGRAMLARLGTLQMLLSSWGHYGSSSLIYSGMNAIYAAFSEIWSWSENAGEMQCMEMVMELTHEFLAASSASCKVDLESLDTCRARYEKIIRGSRIGALMRSVLQIKELIRLMNGALARKLSRTMGMKERDRIEQTLGLKSIENTRLCCGLKDLGEEASSIRASLARMRVRTLQGIVVFELNQRRYALGKCDMERLHQMVMSATSALVGAAAQASVGTALQTAIASRAVGVAERNIGRIVESSKMVPVGDEVLICKAYRRAYTAHLGKLAGPMCALETEVLIRDAEETAEHGVIDVAGFLADLARLDAASSLNAGKMFKMCPAPDVSPGTAMMDRIEQIGNGNEVDRTIMGEFEIELRNQILRAFIRSTKKKVPLRSRAKEPAWYTSYLKGEFDMVPSSELHEYLAWEGKAEMPETSQYDPTLWKDSGIGADTKREAERPVKYNYKKNMITRLIFDEECPMPGSKELNDEHVIKFFVKAEGHKDPARGIFSANLMDRQAQSWLERAVEAVALSHPSFMIGQPVDKKEAKVIQLTRRPIDHKCFPLYYSFDISGWSAKMPAEPQRISHNIWAELYNEQLFRRATEINENAYIYMTLDGYRGWYENTHSNLEGFNGKEMTMVLIALLSLSVKRWRTRIVDAGLMSKEKAELVMALLFAYIDDGLSRIDLPRDIALAGFQMYKDTVIETFSMCGFSVEISKCFPSDRFAIFLNEVYLAGRHVVHGVRAAMAISSEPTERHMSLIERTSSVATGCRGSVMAGLSAASAVMLMAYHTYMHIIEWTDESDARILTTWSFAPRAWGGLGLPNILQLYTSGSGSAFEEGISTLQGYAKMNKSVCRAFTALCKANMKDRESVSVMSAPLSSRIARGYMIDSRITVAVRKALGDCYLDGRLSTYAERLLKYADSENYKNYANAVISVGQLEVLQEQLIDDVRDAHPHSIFSAFARRLEKSTTVRDIVGFHRFREILQNNREEAKVSIDVMRKRFSAISF